MRRAPFARRRRSISRTRAIATPLRRRPGCVDRRAMLARQPSPGLGHQQQVRREGVERLQVLAPVGQGGMTVDLAPEADDRVEVLGARFADRVTGHCEVYLLRTMCLRKIRL